MWPLRTITTSTSWSTAAGLLWAGTTGDDVVFAKCSDDGETVASYSKDNAVSFFDRKGEQLWTTRVNRKITCMDLSTDGSFAVVGSADGTLRVFDRSGNVSWSKVYQKPVTTVCVSGSGALVLAGTADNRAYMFGKDGVMRWEFIAGSPVVHVYTSYDGENNYVLETTNNTLHLLSDRGGELAENSYSQRITDISITEDGRYVAIGFANSFVYYTERNFQQLWRQPVPGPVERIKISGDGSLVFVSTADGGVYILNKKGQILLKYPFDCHRHRPGCDLRRRVLHRQLARYGLHVCHRPVPAVHRPRAGEDSEGCGRG